MRINCHTHIFSIDCVPLEFRERFLLNTRRPVLGWLHGVVRRLLPPQCMLAGWLSIVDMSIAEIAARLLAEMDEAGIDICTPLMMDMAYCQSFGGSVLPFEDQIAQTTAAVQAINTTAGRPRMLPFIAADPNRPDVVPLVIEALDSGAFKGVKVYPPMGFAPDDRRLYPIYEHCVAHSIPITAHCQNGGVPGLHGYYKLAAPQRWEPVLADFPTLTLDLAHNDRHHTRWQRRIATLIRTFPNVYTDISYGTEMWTKPARYFKHIKRMLADPSLRDRVLYGTDWYMGRCLWTEKTYLDWFRDYARRIFWCRVTFTPDDMNRLTDLNPRRFLSLTENAG